MTGPPIQGGLVVGVLIDANFVRAFHSGDSRCRQNGSESR